MNYNKNILSKRIKNLRKNMGLTQEELALKLGLKGKSSIANYESGHIIPSDEVKLNICKLFECSMDYLMGITDYKNEHDYIDKTTEQAILTANNDAYLIRKYPDFDADIIANEMIIYHKKNEDYTPYLNSVLNKFPTDDQKKVKQVVLYIYNFLLYSPKNSNTLLKIPILGTLKAGYDWLAEENVIGYITDKDTIKNYEKNINEYFALKVTGESMLPLLDNDDIVIFHKQDDVESGQTAIILIENEEAIIRKVIKTNEGIELHAMNPYYPIRKFTFDEINKIPVKIIGRVKEAKIKGAFE